MGAKGFDSRITPLNGSRAIPTGAKSYTRVRFPTPHIKEKDLMEIRRYLKGNKGETRNYIFKKKIYARYLMENKISRKLKTDELVHHINGNCLDDRIENLSIVSKAEHLLLHIGDIPPNRILNNKDAKTLKEMIIKRGKLSLRKLANLLGFKSSLLQDISSGRSYINI